MGNWTIENFAIVGQVMLKMLGSFWPIVLIAGVAVFIEIRKELADENR